jgi:hypothetical protein
MGRNNLQAFCERNPENGLKTEGLTALDL